MNARASTPFDRDRLQSFARLTRLDRPIGILLLLWPTLWALWLAAGGVPPLGTLAIFVLGTVLTRSAGCAINDYADRDIDGQVARTRDRPLATGALRPTDALLATGVLLSAAFALVLLTNTLTVALSLPAAALAIAYPFTKRVTHFPQVVLGAAFAMAVPMAFAAVRSTVPASAWVVFAAAVLWAIAYDTLYAMADRDDDVIAGVKSTAVLFGRHELTLVAVAHVGMLALLGVVGALHQLGAAWYLGLAAAFALAVRQWRHARTRSARHCFEAFKQNSLLGAVVFVGLVLDVQFVG